MSPRIRDVKFSFLTPESSLDDTDMIHSDYVNRSQTYVDYTRSPGFLGMFACAQTVDISPAFLQATLVQGYLSLQ